MVAAVALSVFLVTYLAVALQPLPFAPIDRPAAALIGAVQNKIIGMAAKGAPGYLEYLGLALPAGALALAVNAAVLQWLFRNDLPAGSLRERVTPRPAFQRPLAGKGLLALALFVALAASGRSLAGAALLAASVLIVVARMPPRTALARVDWILLLFFGAPSARACARARRTARDP